MQVPSTVLASSLGIWPVYHPTPGDRRGRGTKRHLQLKMVCFILTNEASFKMQTTEEKHGLLEAFSLTVTMLGSQKY